MALGLFFLFFGGHLPQTSGFRSAKQILVVSFATQPRAFILSDRNIFYTPPGGRTTAGSNAPGAFLVTPPSGRGLVIPVFFFVVVVSCPRPPLGQNNTCR